MRKISRKILPSIVLFALVILASGFCYGSIASAYVIPAVPVQQSVSADSSLHCGNETKTTITVEVKKEVAKYAREGGGPIVLPCCVDRHTGQLTFVPNTLKDKIKFSSAIITTPDVTLSLTVQQAVAVFAHAPPNKPDILSSVVKKE